MLDHSKGMVELNKYVYRQPLIRLVRFMGNSVALRLKKYKGVDLGCGPCKLLSEEGLDSSPEMVQSARDRNPGCSIILGDIFNLPYEDSSLQSVSLNGVLEHLSPLSSALAEIRRVLKPGGEVIFQIPTEGFLYKIGREFTTARLARKVIEEPYPDFLRAEHVNTCKGVLGELDQFFGIRRLIGIPFGIPMIGPNLLLVGRYVRG